MNGKSRILILEDDDTMRGMLVEVLQDEGLAVEAVARGEDAVDLASRQETDLVILDVRMEGIDGLEALELMRSHLNEAAALVITGYACEEDTIRALRLGVSDYLRKPFELAHFLDKVHTLLAETFRRRLKNEREKRLGKLTRWALQALVTVGEGHIMPVGSSGDLRQTANVTRHTASLTGIVSPDAEELEAAVMLARVADLTKGQLPVLPADLPTLSLVLQRLMAREGLAPEADNGEAGSSPDASSTSLPNKGLAPQIALAVLGRPEAYPAISCRAEGEDYAPYAEARSSSCAPVGFYVKSSGQGYTTENAEDQVDPLVWQALLKAQNMSEESDASSEGHALLELAHLMMSAGRWSEAEMTLLKAAASPYPAQTIRACLLLGQLPETRLGRTDRLKYLDKAIAMAQNMGPAAYAQAAFQSGLALWKVNDLKANQQLKLSYSLLQKLNLEPQRSQNLLLLGTVCHVTETDRFQALCTLLHPCHRQALYACREWIWPALFNNTTDAHNNGQGPTETDRNFPQQDIAALLTSLLRFFPYQAAQSLASGIVSGAGRSKLMQLMALHSPILGPKEREVLAASAEAEVRAFARSLPQISGSGHSVSSRQLPTLCLCALGRLQLCLMGEISENILMVNKKELFLLAYLLRQPQPSSEDSLICDLWPDYDRDRGRLCLNSALCRLRRMLKNSYKQENWESLLGSAGDFFLRTQGHISIHPALPVWHDAQEMRQSRHNSTSISELHHLTELYQGSYLPGCYQEWANEIRLELEAVQESSLEKLSRHYLSAQDWERSLEYSQRLLQLNPFNEEGRAMSMRSCLNLRRFDKAREIYKDYLRLLNEDDNRAPGWEVMRLYHASEAQMVI